MSFGYFIENYEAMHPGYVAQILAALNNTKGH